MSLDKDITALRRRLKRHCEPWQRSVLEKQLEEALAERALANAAAKATRDAERAATKARREASRQAAKANNLAVISAKKIAPVSGSRYRGRTIDGKRRLAHRVTAGLEVGDKRDAHHVDHDVGNNIPTNLKAMTHQENCNLRRKRGGNTSSRFIGGSWDKSRGKWKFRIKLKDGRTKHLGYFASEEEGRDRYNIAVIEEYGLGNKTLNVSETAGTVWDIIQAVIQDSEHCFRQIRENAWIHCRPALLNRPETGDTRVIDEGILSRCGNLGQATNQSMYLTDSTGDII